MDREIVLLTGATGFLGSHLLRILIKNKFKVIILKRTFSDTWRIKDLLGGVVSYDIDESDISEIFRKHKIDVVIHTATLYGRKKEKISEIVNANLILPLKLLELSVKFGIKAFVNTDTFFKSDMSLPNNLNYYVLSKKQFLEYVKRICEKGSLKFINLQLAHMYGPMDSPSKFVPSVVRKMILGEEVDLTKGEQKWDFIYVEDVASAYLCVINNLEKISKKYLTYELGSSVSTSIKEIVLLIKRLSESDSKLNFGSLPYRKNEIMDIRADTSSLTKLGWGVFYNLEKGFKKTVDYYKK